MDELTDEQITELRAQLEASLIEIEAGLEGASDRTATVDLDQPIGRLSRMDAMQQQEMAKEQMRRNRLRVAQIKQALTRFEDGEYGLCGQCEEPIGYKRLRARPEAPLCVECRSEIERR